MCAGSKPNSSNDIEADDHSSNIEARPDFALSPKCPPTDIEDVAIVGCDPPKDFDFSLSPTPEWREEAIKCIEKFSGRTIPMQVFMRMGLPQVVVSDQGREFSNNLDSELAKCLGITRRLTTPYHPQVLTGICAHVH